MSFGPQKNDQMHPEDTRNLLVFFAVSVLLWIGFNHFILEPQKKALEAATQAQVEQAQIQQENPVEEIKPLSREEAVQNTARVQIDNTQIFGSLSLTGGRIDDLALREYFKTLEKQEHVVLLSPKETEKPRYIEYGWVAKEENIKLPGPETRWRIRGSNQLGQDQAVTLSWENGQGLVFERVVALDQDYLFTITQKVTNKSGQKVTLYPYGLISQQGLPEDFFSMWLAYEGPKGFIGDEMVEVSYDDLRKSGSKNIRSASGWAGINEKYWLTSLVPPQGQQVKYSFDYSGDVDNEKNSGRYQIDFVGAPLQLEPGQEGASKSHLYTGPKKLIKLEEYGEALSVPRFDLAVDFGWFWFMSKPFFYALHYLGEFVGNMGFAIIILTILIRGSVYPLTNASYRSFGKMKLVTPQVVALREQYGDDKQKMQSELVELYQREGVNPMAGCVPILIQIPIFFALYKVLLITIEVRHAPFIGWIKDLSVPDPTTIFNLFGLIPWDPPNFLNVGVWPLFMLVAMLIQRKLNPPPQDQLQRDMALYFPFVITFIMAKFAAGLVIYWAFSAWIGLLQQMIIMRRMGVPIHLFGETEEEKAATEGVDVHSLAEMAEEEAEEALFGEHETELPKGSVSKPKPKKSKKKKK